MMNARYCKLATEQQVTTAITSIADELLRDYPTSPLFVSLLRGAVPFSARLMSALVEAKQDFHPELDYLSISAYGKNHEPATPEILTSLSPQTVITGRQVVVFDDVVNNGVTSAAARHLLIELGAAEVKLAVLVAKMIPGREIEADYVGMRLPNTWLVGMGLDDAKAGTEAYRWLPEIWEIKH